MSGDDIVERLRYFGEFRYSGERLTLVTVRTSDLREAADEIERLRAAAGYTESEQP